MEVDVRWFSGEALATVSVESDWTVAKLREAVRPHAAESSAAVQLGLLLDYAMLDDPQTLEECGVGPGSVVHAVDRHPALARPLVKLLAEQRRLTDTEVCQLTFRASGDEMNAKDNELTVLHLCADRGCTSACTALLRNQQFTESNTKDGAGFTGLHWAAVSGHPEVCRVLLDHPKFTEANARNAGGQTALHVAAASGHAEVCLLLHGHHGFTAQQTRDHRARTAPDVATEPVQEALGL